MKSGVSAIQPFQRYRLIWPFAGDRYPVDDEKDPLLSMFVKRFFNLLRVQPLPGNSFKKRFAPYFFYFLNVITCLSSSVNAILSAFK